MTGDPANVRGAEVNVLLLIIKNVFVRGGGVHHVSAGSVHHSLGFSGRTGSVENEQGIFRIHFLAGTIRRCPGHRLVPPKIPAFLHLTGNFGILPYPAHHDTGLDGLSHTLRSARHSLIRVGFHGNRLGSPKGSIGRDQSFAVRIHDPVGQGFSGKSPEDHRMHRPDSGAGKHGHRRFGNHGHVNRYPVALLDAPTFQDVGKFRNPFMQVPIGNLRILPRFVPLPDDRRLVGPGLQMPIDAIVADVGLRTLEPFDGNRTLATIVIISPNLIPFRIPMKILRHFRPKTIGIFDTPLIHGLVFFHALQVSILGYGGWRRHKIVRFGHKAKGEGDYFVNF